MEDTTDRALALAYGQRWLDTPDGSTDPETIKAYAEFVEQVAGQLLAMPIRVQSVPNNPYRTAGQMFADIEKGHLYVWHTQPDQLHPLLTPNVNDMFRAVHDYWGHFISGGDFTIPGEMAAFEQHLKMFTGPAREVLIAETAGQLGAYFLLGRQFPKQKAIRLEEICES